MAEVSVKDEFKTESGELKAKSKFKFNRYGATQQKNRSCLFGAAVCSFMNKINEFSS